MRAVGEATNKVAFVHVLPRKKSPAICVWNAQVMLSKRRKPEDSIKNSKKTTAHLEVLYSWQRSSMAKEVVCMFA